MEFVCICQCVFVTYRGFYKCFNGIHQKDVTAKFCISCHIEFMPIICKRTYSETIKPIIDATRLESTLLYFCDGLILGLSTWS